MMISKKECTLKDNLPFIHFLDKHTNGLLVLVDNDLVYANEKIKKIFELDLEINLPISLADVFPEKNYGTLHADFLKIEEGKASYLKIGTKSKPISLKAKLTRHFNNNISYEFITIDTINENQLINEGPLEHFSELFPFVIIEIDAKGLIYKYNCQFEKQLFYSKKDVQNGLGLMNLASVGSKPILHSFINGKHKEFDNEGFELKLKKKNGETFYAKLYLKPRLVNTKQLGLTCLLLDISDTKQIEKKFYRNQRRLRKVLDLVPHMIFLKDINGEILLANKACGEFYNTTTKDLVYSNISKFHENHKEYQRIVQQDKEVIKSNVKKEWSKLVLTNANNELRTFKTAKVPFKDSDSGQIYSLGISVDITEQQRTEQETKETKEKYRILVERGTDGILILNDDRVVFANKQAARIFGYQVDEFLLKPLNTIVRKNQLQRILKEYRKNRKNKELNNYYQVKIHKPNKETVYVEAMSNTISYESKKSILVFLRDVTKRKLAEKSSERDKNMLKQAQKITKLGSWELNIQNKSFYCSDEIHHILDISADENIKLDSAGLIDFVPKKERSRLFRGLINSKNLEDKYEHEFPIVSAKGKRKIIHSQSQVFKDGKGKPERVIGTWLDISERIRFEQILKEAKLKAEESDKLKSAFLANMSHEIRTPMNAILGFANLLKRKNIENNMRYEYIDHILQSGEGLIKLINDIIDVSKIESNQLQIEEYPVSLNNILDQLYNRYEELLALKNQNNIKITIERALPDPEFTILTDPYRLQQVISNLMNNAMKFTINGNVSFGYSIVKSELLFFVKDQGIGIPENKREQIFKRFGKLEDSERMNKSGTGLGLSISKSLVELMGGRIWLDSSTEFGTKFCFTIPLKYAKRKKSIKKQGFNLLDNKEINLNGKTILIAEDELLNYKLLEALLLKTGAEVLWAKNGLEAVSFVSDRKIDIVFMDIKMPEMNGYEATKHIKRIDSSIPVIAQTAFAFANERKYILQSGCDTYITKPINSNELYKTLRNYLLKK